MRFKLTSDAKKYLEMQDKEAVKRIYDALRKLTKDPPEGDIKPLQGQDNIKRLRVGDYRILFETDGSHVIIDFLRNYLRATNVAAVQRAFVALDPQFRKKSNR